MTSNGRPKGQAKTGGRQKGSRNKVTCDVKAAALEHGPAALERVAKLMKSKTEQVAFAACRQILDRAYGKSTQRIETEVSFYDSLSYRQPRAGTLSPVTSVFG